MTFGIEEPLLQRTIAERNIPSRPDRSNFPARSQYLQVDYGTRATPRLFIISPALGHRRITLVDLAPHSARARVEAFRLATKAAKIPSRDARVIEADHTLEGGMLAFEGVRARGELPTAVMCSNDMTAIGVLRSAYATGMKVPKDLSIIGFDDIRFAQFTTPPITTVQMSRVDLAGLLFRRYATTVDRL